MALNLRTTNTRHPYYVPPPPAARRHRTRGRTFEGIELRRRSERLINKEKSNRKIKVLLKIVFGVS
jgi:hypothetical protein